jgi:hypothetical protein
MLEWLKTTSGAYNLTFIVAMISWLVGGVGLVAGFHLNKVKTIEVEAKAKKAESDRAAIALQLETAKAKTAELETQIAPRQLSDEQRTKFVKFLDGAPKGPVAIIYVSPGESMDFAEQIRSLMESAGFSVPPKPEYAFGIAAPTRPPWFVTILVNNSGQPLYTGPLQRAFQHVGIDAIGIDGLGNPPPGELKIYIGNK